MGKYHEPCEWYGFLTRTGTLCTRVTRYKVVKRTHMLFRGMSMDFKCYSINTILIIVLGLIHI